jgi:hypothetical protein
MINGICEEDIMDDELNSRIKEIAEKMEEEGRPMINLSRLFIEKELSLVILFILEDNGSATVDQISNIVGGEYSGEYSNEDIKVILDELKGFDVIDVKNDIVNLTDRGQCIIMKLRKKINNVGNGPAKLCNIKHDCIYNFGDC